VFVDRDGTLIEDRHYLADPRDVRLLPGVATALGRLRAAGFAIVVVTNQSGIARGLLTRAQYDAVHERLAALLHETGVDLDGTYMCPHHPEITGACDCRKPAPGLFRLAAKELGLDLQRSVLVGDRWRDVAAAKELGARAFLIRGPETTPEDVSNAGEEVTVTDSLGDAADAILRRLN
jgi:histidinol-phosphate phosphatase family protein